MASDPEGASVRAGQRASLTPAERTMLDALARGAGVRAAAETLGQPEHEVRAQLVSAGRKLGARSVLEALIIAVRRGDVRRPIQD